MTKKGKRHSFKKNDLIDSIINMRIEKGMSRTSILEFLKKDIGLSQPYAYELIRDASNEFDNRAIQNFGEDLKEDIERFERLYEKAMLSANMKEARECLKEISKLKGHYKERIELSGEIFIAKFPGLDKNDDM
jgi:hypothetical protein